VYCEADYLTFELVEGRSLYSAWVDERFVRHFFQCAVELFAVLFEVLLEHFKHEFLVLVGVFGEVVLDHIGPLEELSGGCDSFQGLFEES
jgi:hypothetical protein